MAFNYAGQGTQDPRVGWQPTFGKGDPIPTPPPNYGGGIATGKPFTIANNPANQDQLNYSLNNALGNWRGGAQVANAAGNPAAGLGFNMPSGGKTTAEILAGTQGLGPTTYGQTSFGQQGGGGGGMVPYIKDWDTAARDAYIKDIFGKQEAENLWARQQQEAMEKKTWDQMMAAQQGYKSSPITQANQALTQQLLANPDLGAYAAYMGSPLTQGSQRLTQQLLDNPEAISDRVQQLIQNKAANQIDAQTRAMETSGLGALAAGGQLDAGSIAAMQGRMGGQGMATRAATMSDLEQQRAIRRNQDIMNAAGMGRAQSQQDLAAAQQRNQDYLNALGMGQKQAGQDFGVEFDVASLLRQTQPQYKPQDLSGYAALAPGAKAIWDQYSSGGGGGAADMMAGGGPTGAAADMINFLKSGKTVAGNYPFSTTVAGGGGGAPAMFGNYYDAMNAWNTRFNQPNQPAAGGMPAGGGVPGGGMPGGPGPSAGPGGGQVGGVAPGGMPSGTPTGGYGRISTPYDADSFQPSNLGGAPGMFPSGDFWPSYLGEPAYA